jgi:hypothetical protein
MPSSMQPFHVLQHSHQAPYDIANDGTLPVVYALTLVKLFWQHVSSRGHSPLCNSSMRVCSRGHSNMRSSCMRGAAAGSAAAPCAAGSSCCVQGSWAGMNYQLIRQEHSSNSPLACRRQPRSPSKVVKGSGQLICSSHAHVSRRVGIQVLVDGTTCHSHQPAACHGLALLASMHL